MQLIKRKGINLRNLICLILLICSLVLINTDSSASEQLRIDTIHLYPFGFFTEHGKSTGLLYDMGNLIAQEAGFSYKNRIVPFARMIMELEHGKADFGLFFRSEKNDKIVIPVSHVLLFKNVVMSLRGAKYESLESLHGKLKVPGFRGARYDESFEKDNLINKYDTTDYHESIRLLFKKRVDAIIGPEIGLLFTAKEFGYSKKDFCEPLVLNTKEVWMQFSKKTAEEKKTDALKSAVEKLLQGGTIQNLTKKYIGE